MQYLIKSLGVAEAPLADFWIATKTDLERLAFPRHRRPHVEPGDRVLIYATGWQRLIAAGEITSESEHDPDVLMKEHAWDPEEAERWPWVATWEPQNLVPFVRQGPTLDDIGVSTLSIRSQSHIFIDEGTYRRTVGLLATAAAANGEVYVPSYRDSLPGS